MSVSLSQIVTSGCECVTTITRIMFLAKAHTYRREVCVVIEVERRGFSRQCVISGNSVKFVMYSIHVSVQQYIRFHIQ